MNPVTTSSEGQTAETETPVALKFCMYARKSSEQDERQALSIDQQIAEMEQFTKQAGLDVVEVRKESHSSKVSGTRPVFNGILSDIRAGEFNALAVWAPDRLSRNAGDLGSLVDLMDKGLLHEIRTPSQTFTNNPNEKFLLMILGSQAKLENDNRGLNVKRGLRGKAESGWRPGFAAIGYLNRHDGDEKIVKDPERAPVVKEMFERVADGATGRAVVTWLNETGFTTRSGKRLSLAAVYRTLRNSFYIGQFQYGGTWYEGKHKQLISKELFEKVQTQLTVAPKAKAGTKEFSFTRMLKCGVCGSGVTAEEKFKHIKKDGSVRRYVYYHCGRSRDFQCPDPYITEPELMRQLTELIDKLPINEIGAKEKFREEFSRYRKFTTGVLGKADQRPTNGIDLRTYAKYVLEEGTKDEKREILTCVTGKLRLKDRQIYVERQNKTKKI